MYVNLLVYKGHKDCDIRSEEGAVPRNVKL